VFQHPVDGVPEQAYNGPIADALTVFAVTETSGEKLIEMHTTKIYADAFRRVLRGIQYPMGNTRRRSTGLCQLTRLCFRAFDLTNTSGEQHEYRRSIAAC
jgi:hypothetical protein